MDNRPLMVGFGVAVALHLFIGMPVIARAFGIGDPSAMFSHEDAREEAERRRKDRLAQALQEHAENPPEPKDDIPEVVPGMEDGSETSMAWIGAEEYEEHMARLGEVDQGGFRMNDSGGGARASGPPQSGPDAPPGAQGNPAPPAPQVAQAAPDAPASPAQQVAQPLPPTPALPETVPPPAATPPQEPAAAVQPQPSQPPPIEAVRPATPQLPPEPRETPGTAPEPTPSSQPPTGTDLPPAEPSPTGTAPPAIERPRTPDPAVQPAPTAPSDPARTPEPIARETPPATEPAATVTPTPPPPAEPVPTQPEAAVTPAQPTPAQPTPAQPAPPAQAPGAGGATTPSPSGVTGPGQGPGKPQPGQKSDRESDATSVIDVPPEKWRTGAPLAHKGVEILTRRPELPILTKITTRPFHPVADIFFDNQGKPVRVIIVNSSGYPDDIDQPVIDALYRWRAKGAQLARLPEGKVARFRVRVILD